MDFLGKLIGVLLCILGVALFGYAFYFGIVECFIGGFVDIINQVKAEVTVPSAVAWGVAKIIFCEIPILLIVLVAGIPFITGCYLLGTFKDQ